MEQFKTNPRYFDYQLMSKETLLWEKMGQQGEGQVGAETSDTQLVRGTEFGAVRCRIYLELDKENLPILCVWGEGVGGGGVGGRSGGGGCVDERRGWG